MEYLGQWGCRLKNLNLQEILIEGYLILLQEEELRDPVEKVAVCCRGRQRHDTHSEVHVTTANVYSLTPPFIGGSKCPHLHT